jgi:hypothetical protein
MVKLTYIFIKPLREEHMDGASLQKAKKIASASNLSFSSE